VTIKPIKTFEQAQKFLLALPKSGGVVFRAGFGLARARQLFDLLGNPEEHCPVIHIAATSGKGSIAYTVDALLKAAGKKTGLHVSPHVADIRERMLINGQPISEREFCELANQIADCLPTMEASELGAPTYFEATVAMAYLAFQKHGVDYAITETGLGGTYDATNLINRKDKLAIIGQIGLDHVSILGDTLEAIAEQKAGIIQEDNLALVLYQEPKVNKVISARANQVGANLEFFERPKRVQHVHVSDGGTIYNFKSKPWIWRELKVGLIGAHQATNTGLALQAVQLIAQRDGLTLSEQSARHTLSSLRIPARFEIKHFRDGQKSTSKTVIVDGAHNPQKMESVARAIKQAYPGRHVTVLMAMKEDKDCLATIQELKPVSQTYITTSFFTREQDYVNMSMDPKLLAATIEQLGSKAKAILDPQEALKAALEMTKDILLVTGSFYFIGEIYKELPS
jgi:dihydrofolate synthase / folylpolyglutamate synthase